MAISLFVQAQINDDLKLARSALKAFDNAARTFRSQGMEQEAVACAEMRREVTEWIDTHNPSSE